MCFAGLFYLYFAYFPHEISEEQEFERHALRVPLHVSVVIDDPNDQLWAWKKFIDICDSHIMERSKFSPWISNAT